MQIWLVSLAIVPLLVNQHFGEAKPKQRQKIQLSNLTFSFDASFVELNISTRTVSRTEYLLDLDLTTKKRFSSNLFIKIDVNFKIADSKRFQNLISFNKDICETMDNFYHDILFQKVLYSFDKSGHIALKCPIEPGYYYMKAYRFDVGLFPTFLISGDYEFLISIYNMLDKPHTFAKIFLSISWKK